MSKELEQHHHHGAGEEGQAQQQRQHHKDRQRAHPADRGEGLVVLVLAAARGEAAQLLDLLAAVLVVEVVGGEADKDGQPQPRVGQQLGKDLQPLQPVKSYCSEVTSIGSAMVCRSMWNERMSEGMLVSR